MKSSEWMRPPGPVKNSCCRSAEMSYIHQMLLSEDNTPSFYPKNKPKLVILGTMVAICARTIDGRPPQEKVFYYHNNRNHFWRVLQKLCSPDVETKTRLTINEKKSLLNQYGIAIINLVQSIKITKKDSLDPSDTILFAAHKKGKLEFKAISQREKKIIESTPLAFTCRSKPGIQRLINGYWEKNQITPGKHKDILFLATPTRCNPENRAQEWRNEIIEHYGSNPLL